MSKKRIVISMYVVAICLLALKLILGAVQIPTTTGYINSEGKLVITNSWYSGQSNEVMRVFNALKNICNVLMWVYVVLGTVCLIFMRNDKNAEESSSDKIIWIYDDEPEDGWKCSKCGTINAQYTETCSCGNRKPSQY